MGAYSAVVMIEPEDEPTADTGQEEVGVLAVPAETGAVRHGAIDDRVVVGEGDRPLVGTPDRARHLAQCDAQRRVVVGPGVPADTGVGRAGIDGGFVVGQIGAGGDDDRRRVLDRS